MPSASASADFGRHAERAQHIDDEPVAHAHAIGQRVCLSRSGIPRDRGAPSPDPARLRREMVLIAVACDTPSRRAMSVGRASPSPVQQIGDQFGVILKQRGRLRRPRLAETARLGRLRRGACPCREPGPERRAGHIAPVRNAQPQTIFYSSCQNVANGYIL